MLLLVSLYCICRNAKVINANRSVSSVYYFLDLPSYCVENEESLFLLAAKMSNEYAKILLHDRVQSILIDAFYYVSPQSIIGQKLSHMLSVLYFAQGGHSKVRHNLVREIFGNLPECIRAKNYGRLLTRQTSSP